MTAPTLALALGLTRKEAQWFLDSWFSNNPEIKEWQNRIEDELMLTRTITNIFGYRRYYFDRVEGLLSEALAWSPQSTVALVIDKGWENIVQRVPQVEVLLQVHDSLVFQYPQHLRGRILPQVEECMAITLPFEDPLIIGTSTKYSAESWGHCG